MASISHGFRFHEILVVKQNDIVEGRDICIDIIHNFLFLLSSINLRDRNNPFNIIEYAIIWDPIFNHYTRWVVGPLMNAVNIF